MERKDFWAQGHNTLKYRSLIRALLIRDIMRHSNKRQKMDWVEVGLSALVGGVIGGGVTGIASHFLKNHPDKEKRLKHISTASIILVIVAVNAGLGKQLRTWMSPSYRAQQILATQLNEILTMPEVKAKLGNDQATAHAQAFILAQGGIKHLTLPELDRWLAIKIKISNNHRNFCIAQFTGQANEDDIIGGIGTLSDEELIEFGKILAIGIKRKVLNEGDSDTHMSYLQTAIKEIIAGLPESDQTKIASAMQGKSQPDEVCWASKVLMTGLTKLPDDQRLKAIKASSGVL